MAQDTTLVVGEVPIATSNSFGLFDHSVEAFGASVGDVLGESDQDG